MSSVSGMRLGSCSAKFVVDTNVAFAGVYVQNFTYAIQDKDAPLYTIARLSDRGCFALPYHNRRDNSVHVQVIPWKYSSLI